MKIEWNKKYTTISVYAFFVACFSMLFYSIMNNIESFMLEVNSIITMLSSIFIGGVFAYLLNFILKFYEDKLLDKTPLKNAKKSQKRGLGLLLTYSTLFILIGIFIKFVAPQLADSIIKLVNDIPTYINNATELINRISGDLKIDKNTMDLIMNSWSSLIEKIIGFATTLLPILADTVKNLASSIWNVILGLIISVYLLIEKENLIAISKKIIYAIFKYSHAKTIIKLAKRSNRIFGKFISGKIIDSTIIGILTFIILLIFKMPYTALISVIIGVTNVIPFFGPFIGAIPSVFIIALVSPVKALWFILIIIVIQQLDGNLIGPKILGDAIGVSAFWIIISILIAGELFGFIGMVIGVPMFAIIYSIIKDVVEAKLREKGMPVETEKYLG